ncbi:MAG: autotransporter adhesin family protein, partial [Roseburia sp.]|nr:autotransporter adhesin family protein [Roseburia sp.]
MEQKVLKAKTVVFSLVLILVALCAVFAFMFMRLAAHADGEDVQPAAIYVLGADDVSDTEHGFDITEATDGQPATYKYASHSAGWSAAVRRSKLLAEEGNNRIKVIVASDWTATPSADGTNTSFGDGIGFDAGAIWVEKDADIILDLSGNKIDRGLSEKDAVNKGAVFFVNGNLVVEDSSGDDSRLIIGGNNTAWGGAFSSGGDLTITGGAISGNRSATAGGAIYSTKALTVSGGSVSDNTCGLYGGGVVFEGTFIMTGGAVSHNNSVDSTGAYGGGVMALSGTFKMSGGEISYNTATANAMGSAMGGGIWMNSQTVLEMSGTAKVIGNTLRAPYSTNASMQIYGGGVFINANNARFTLSDDAKISGNEMYRQIVRDGEYTPDKTYAGGVMVSSNSYFTMTGGKICDNLAGRSGAIEVASFVTVTGGVISGNRATMASGGMHFIAASSASNQRVLKLGGNPIIKDNICYSNNYGETVAIEDKDGKQGYRSDITFNKGDNYRVEIIDELTDGADIRFLIDGGAGQIKTDGYAEHNSELKTVNGTEYRIVKDPSAYIKSDSNRYMVLTASGEVAEIEHELTIGATYNGVTADAAEYYGKEFEYEKGSEVIGTAAYNGEDQDVAVKRGEDIPTDFDAGVYTVNVNVNGVDVAYTAVVLPKKLDVSKAPIEINDTFNYDGNAKEPAFTLSESGNELDADTDYTYEYGNNINAGNKAEIVVTYKGNYQGIVTYYFTIEALSAEYTVEWQYKNGDNWSAIPAATPFTYNAVDYTYSVRAALSVSGITEYVYAASENDELNTTNMYLTFVGTFEGSPVTELLNATAYTVTVAGSPNYAFAQGENVRELTIAPRTLDLSASDFVDYARSGEDNRLWLLQLGDDTTSELRDLATYFDPDAAFDEAYGANVVTGTLYNAYVRYTGTERTIVLNEDYRIKNTTLGAYMSSVSSIRYNNSNTAVGEADKVNKITTIVRIDLNGNWAVESGGANFIELTKDWYIVTINNALRTMSGDTDTSVASFTFGDKVTAVPFRPEHGDTAVYTLNSGASVVTRFAAVFDGAALLGGVTYYEVKWEGGNYVADTS